MRAGEERRQLPVLMKLGPDRVVNLLEVSAFHLDGDKLFVHYGGKIWSYTGATAAAAWAFVQNVSFDPVEASQKVAAMKAAAVQ